MRMRFMKNLINDKQKHIAEMMFRALTERADRQRDTRRPQPLAEIVELTVTGESFSNVVAVIDEFRQTGRCFLMPPVNVKLNNDCVIDISHESLIRQWQTLQKWVEDEAENAKTYQRLEDRALEWQKGKTDFLQSPELEIYQQWWRGYKPTKLLVSRYGESFLLAQQFFYASQKSYYIKQGRKNTRRSLLIIVLVSFSFAAFGFWQYRIAQIETVEIKKKAQVTKDEMEKYKEHIQTLKNEIENVKIGAATSKNEMEVIKDKTETVQNKMEKIEKYMEIAEGNLAAAKAEARAAVSQNRMDAIEEKNINCKMERQVEP